MKSIEIKGSLRTEKVKKLHTHFANSKIITTFAPLF